MVPTCSNVGSVHSLVAVRFDPRFGIVHDDTVTDFFGGAEDTESVVAVVAIEVVRGKSMPSRVRLRVRGFVLDGIVTTASSLGT